MLISLCSPACYCSHPALFVLPRALSSCCPPAVLMLLLLPLLRSLFAACLAPAFHTHNSTRLIEFTSSTQVSDRHLDNQPRADLPVDSQRTTWNHEFAPAINQYLRATLGFKTDLQVSSAAAACRRQFQATVASRRSFSPPPPPLSCPPAGCPPAALAARRRSFKPPPSRLQLSLALTAVRAQSPLWQLPPAPTATCSCCHLQAPPLDSHISCRRRRRPQYNLFGPVHPWARDGAEKDQGVRPTLTFVFAAGGRFASTLVGHQEVPRAGHF